MEPHHFLTDPAPTKNKQTHTKIIKFQLHKNQIEALAYKPVLRCFSSFWLYQNFSNAKEIPYVLKSGLFVLLLMYYNIFNDTNFSSSKSGSSRDRHNHSRDKDKHKHSSSNSSSRDKKRSRDDSRDGHRSSKKARYGIQRPVVSTLLVTKSILMIYSFFSMSYSK